jgi:glycosyltransferase involved in cell wall biosynthesis
LDVFAGEPRPEENIVVADELDVAKYVHARNVHISRGRSYFCWQRGMRRWLNESQPDALVVSANPRILSSLITIRRMRSRGIPVIGWGLGRLGGADALTGRAISDRLRGKFYGSFDALIAYSSKAAEDYRNAGVPDERIFVAHNAVSTVDADSAGERFPADGDAVTWWRARHNLSRPTIIYVGRLTTVKRVDVLIDACAAIGDDCELVVVGDGPERGALEALAAERFPRAKFLGHQEADALTIAFAGSDLFVLPGTGGLAIYEAMAHGKPVIVGQGDGTESDLVHEGKNGASVRPNDVGELITGIRFFLDQPDEMRRAGIESRRIVSEEISIDRMANTFVTALSYASGFTSVDHDHAGVGRES